MELNFNFLLNSRFQIRKNKLSNIFNISDSFYKKSDFHCHLSKRLCFAFWWVIFTWWYLVITLHKKDKNLILNGFHNFKHFEIQSTLYVLNIVSRCLDFYSILYFSYALKITESISSECCKLSIYFPFAIWFWIKRDIQENLWKLKTLWKVKEKNKINTFRKKVLNGKWGNERSWHFFFLFKSKVGKIIVKLTFRMSRVLLEMYVQF